MASGGRSRDVVPPQANSGRGKAAPAPPPRENNTPRKKRPYSPNEKKEVADKRKEGACDDCRSRKVKCRHSKSLKPQNVETMQGIPLRPPNLRLHPSPSSSSSKVSSLLTSGSANTASDLSLRTESTVSEFHGIHPQILSPEKFGTPGDAPRDHVLENYLQVDMYSGLSGQKFDTQPLSFQDINRPGYPSQENYPVGNMGLSQPSQRQNVEQHQTKGQPSQFQQQAMVFQPQVLGFRTDSLPKAVGHGYPSSSQIPVMTSSGHVKGGHHRRTPSNPGSQSFLQMPGQYSEMKAIPAERSSNFDFHSRHASGSSSQHAVPSQASNNKLGGAMRTAPPQVFSLVGTPQQRTILSRTQQQTRLNPSSAPPNGSAHIRQGQQHPSNTDQDRFSFSPPGASSQLQPNSSQVMAFPQAVGSSSTELARSFNHPSRIPAARRTAVTSQISQNGYIGAPSSETSPPNAAGPSRSMITEDVERLRQRLTSTKAPQQQTVPQYQQPNYHPDRPIQSGYHPSGMTHSRIVPSPQQSSAGSWIQSGCEVCRRMGNQAYRYPCNH